MAKKKSRIVFSFFLVTLAICLLQSLNVSAAASLRKKLTLQNRRTYTLEVTGTTKKVTWSVEDPSIVTVNSKGKVTAKNEGATVVHAKVGKKTLSCDVTVKSPSISAEVVSNLKAAQSTKKIIIVSAVSRTTSSATLQYFRKSGGQWKEVIHTKAYIGKNGLGKTAEGDNKTPVGLYHFTMVMGIASNPGTIMPYHQIDSNDYWCGGPNYYNQFVDEDVQPHLCSKVNDEHLITYTQQYQYLAALDYNPENIYGKGSAIFLHCTGSNPYTAGCIAVSKSDMKKLMKKIDESTVIIIDLASRIKSNY